MEVIVPYHPAVRGMDEIRQHYPEARFLEVPDLRSGAGRGGSREHHDELRARGLAAARGSILAVIEDHGTVAPAWCRHMIEAHGGPWAAVGGAIENGVPRLLNWAVYFCDFLRYQNPVPEGESDFASDANVSYKREALEAIRPVWQASFQETIVHRALQARGGRMRLASGMVLLQQREALRLGAALKERFIWGRSYAAARAGLAGGRQRLFWLALSPALPAVLLARMSAMAAAKRRTLGAFLRALPLTAALTVSWSLGEFTGYLTQRAKAGGAPAAEAIARGSAS